MDRYRKIGLAVMITGVLAGSVFANLTYKANYYFLADLNMDLTVIKNIKDLHPANYAIYIAGKRLFQVLVMAFVFHFFAVTAIIVAAGFTGAFVFSVFLTYQLLQTGLEGVATVLLAMIPQWIFYGAVIWWWIRNELQKRKKEAFHVCLMFLLLLLPGILTEIFVNPVLLSVL